MGAKTDAGRVYDALRSDILACRALPGVKLKIADLCASLDVSNGAVREALSRLSADGLVVSAPQRGFTVAPVSREELLDLTRARIEVEGICLRAAIRNGSIEWESRVVAAFHRLSRIEEREPSDKARLNDAWVAAHGEFHNALVAACGNRWLLKIRGMLYEQSERYRRLSVPVRRGERDVNAEHKAILTSVLARNEDDSTQKMAEHLMITADILLSTPLLASTESSDEAAAAG